MSTIRNQSFFALAGLAALLFTSGCPVDVNEGMGGDDDGPATAECMPEERASIRVFHAAAGTKVVRAPFVAPATPLLEITRPNPEPAPDALTKVAFASLANGRAAYTSLCAKEYTFTARLAGSKIEDDVVMETPDLATTTATLTAGAKYTIIAAGYVDPMADPNRGMPTAQPTRILVIPESFPALGGDAQVAVVHASVLTPSPADVEVNAMTMGAEITALERYAMPSALTTVVGSADTMPTPVAVQFLEGTTPRASFSITPRVPAGTKFFAIHFHTVVYDPDAPAGTPAPRPSGRLFLTGDDPLLGSVPGGGVTFTSSI